MIGTWVQEAFKPDKAHFADSKGTLCGAPQGPLWSGERTDACCCVPCRMAVAGEIRLVRKSRTGVIAN